MDLLYLVLNESGNNDKLISAGSTSIICTTGATGTLSVAAGETAQVYPTGVNNVAITIVQLG